MATPPAPAVRLRLVFDDQRLLRRPQRESGLRRCWFLLPRELATVAGLAKHVAARFRLRRSCPHGVILSMDGFVLPPFESTSIFRDNDIIRVKQKISKKIARHNDLHCIENPEKMEKEPLQKDDEVFAIEYRKDDSKQQEDVQYNNQNGHAAAAHCNAQNDTISLKRKCQDEDTATPGTSKKKKPKVTNSAKHNSCSNKDGAHEDQDLCGSKKLKSLYIGDTKNTLQVEAAVTLDEEQKTERDNQTKLNSETKEAYCNTQSDAKKARRNAQRKLNRLRRKAKEQLDEKVHCQESPTAADCPSSKQNGLPSTSGNQNYSSLPFLSHEADEEESDTSDDIVPVVVRPGHIRFEPAGREPNKSLVKDMQTTFQWSGTMSKKKGQKWGMDNSNKRSSDISYDGRIGGSDAEVNHHMVGNRTNENGFGVTSNQKVGESSQVASASEKIVAEEGKYNSEPLDFESLYPLTRLPKEGDLIVYRLVQLSSLWCPELSSHRVGKVLLYDPISSRIILLPVPEYPIICEEQNGEEELDMPVDMSPYKEDGSLEIEYSSLLDVRLLNGTESIQPVVNTPLAETCNKSGSLVIKPFSLDKDKDKIHSGTVPVDTNNPALPEKTRSTPWEESGEASNEEPAVQENGWGTWTRNTSTSAWSYRALRSSALGPTVALLRGKNTKVGKPYNRKYGK